METYSIALIPGDGIGPEVIAPAVEVLDAAGKKFGRRFRYTELCAGGCAIDKYGAALPGGTLETAASCDALLLGALGGPKWDGLPGGERPEQALLALRKGLGLFANLRPAALFPQLREASPLKEEILAAGGGGFDLLIVRELTGGLYFGRRGRSPDNASAFDTETYSAMEIDRLLRVAYDAARRRRKKLTLVDKANVLESSRLWREVAGEVMRDYPDVATDFLYVDNAAMQLIRCPSRFDVIATSNLFGDILSDEASVLTGSIGMLPSASLAAPAALRGAGGGPAAKPANAFGGASGDASGGPENPGPFGMYEPIHGSAPDIAGKDRANPLGAILSAALMLRYSFGLEAEAQAVEKAVAAALESGLRTADIVRPGSGEKTAGTREMAAAVVKRLG
ncbi:MAG: 3-isopropylmalate dehydrogenase [Treponema sp.]|jgi:3-isopropylmalate dehydrogenase|nr:3-isopropylmalate dehydrogenase [Treponema sp.]